MGFQFHNNLEDTHEVYVLTFFGAWLFLNCLVFLKDIYYFRNYSEKKGETSCKLNGKAPVNYKLGLSLILFFCYKLPHHK